jgi:hypothetical protein
MIFNYFYKTTFKAKKLLRIFLLYRIGNYIKSWDLPIMVNYGNQGFSIMKTFSIIKTRSLVWKQVFKLIFYNKSLRIFLLHRTGNYIKSWDLSLWKPGIFHYEK